MNENIILLKDLIAICELTIQQKLNKIMQTLQITEDPLKARLLSEEILKGNFEDLEDKSIENLVKAFSNVNNNRAIISNISVEEVDEKSNKEMNLEYELKTLKLQLEAIEYKNKKLEETNNKLILKLTLTKNFKLIEVNDEDINELYIRHLQNKQITAYKEAIVLDDIIPKSYYKINE